MRSISQEELQNVQLRKTSQNTMPSIQGIVLQKSTLWSNKHKILSKNKWLNCSHTGKDILMEYFGVLGEEIRSLCKYIAVFRLTIIP